MDANSSNLMIQTPILFYISYESSTITIQVPNAIMSILGFSLKKVSMEILEYRL